MDYKLISEINYDAEIINFSSKSSPEQLIEEAKKDYIRCIDEKCILKNMATDGLEYVNGGDLEYYEELNKPKSKIANAANDYFHACFGNDDEVILLDLTNNKMFVLPLDDWRKEWSANWKIIYNRTFDLLADKEEREEKHNEIEAAKNAELAAKKKEEAERAEFERLAKKFKK